MRESSRPAGFESDWLLDALVGAQASVAVDAK